MQDGEETATSDAGFSTEMLNEIMAGDDILLGFSGGTIAIIIGLVAISVVGGIISRRFLFPRIMDLISKSDRIDGRTLLAPKSVGWMMGFLIFSEMMSWLDVNCEPVWDSSIAENVIEWSFTFFLLGMLLAAYRLVDYLDAFIVVEGEENAASRRSLASVAESIGHLVVALLGAFVVAGLFGLNLNGLIAGLGITGLALALAARDSVANIFGAISIIIDQPFNVGDWILVDDIEGEVVQIGLRTTLIRSSADTLITVPNSNLVNSPVENFSQRRFRRIQPSFEFEADSDPDALKNFCDKLLAKVKEDVRAVKEDDSWVKVNAFGPSLVTVSCNFYSVLSSASMREMTEDILLLAKAIAADCGLTFHEPRLRR
ncbi:MAG: mechanosensitive ion channel family protein [Candidatus Thermoplasmatota archaeon]|nr:mechanosensitive ion channel family protein [Candidatus Thermoplasmatota archaeon]